MKAWPWIEQYKRQWPILDMVKQYLQSQGYNNRKKAQQVKARREESPELEEDDDDANFDPSAALELLSPDKDDEDPDDPAPEDQEIRPKSASKLKGGKVKGPAAHDETDGDVPSKSKRKVDKPMCSDLKSHSVDEGDEPIEDNSPDEDPNGVFLDEFGFFHDADGVPLEATFDDDADAYKLDTGGDITLDAFPETLEDFDDCFGDGIRRRRNAFKQWRVGSFQRAHVSNSPRS